MNCFLGATVGTVADESDLMLMAKAAARRPCIVCVCVCLCECVCVRGHGGGMSCSRLACSVLVARGRIGHMLTQEGEGRGCIFSGEACTWSFLTDEAVDGFVLKVIVEDIPEVWAGHVE